MLLVYTHNLTPRVKYVFKQIFNQVLGVEIEFCKDKEIFKNTKEPKISYTYSPLGDELFFQSDNLLFETGIVERKLSVFKYQDVDCFFPIQNSTLPFDPFASSFFMLSRYEEYLPHIKDKFGRFEAKESLAFKNNFLQKPVVDLWSEMIKKKVKKHYPLYKFPAKKFKYFNTIDVDNAYLYLEKGFVRTLGAFLKDMMYGKFFEQTEKMKVILGFKKDPYDTFDDILKIHKQYKLRTIFFFLLGDYSYYDRGISFSSKKLQEKIKSVGDNCLIGAHPSFASLSNNNLILELNRLKGILHKEIISSRQHFIRLDIPNMYRNLLTTTIRNDYSMGFASMPGFRGGTSNYYYFYDLDLEKATELKIHPFMIMDVTLKDYMGLNSRESISVIKKMIDEVKSVNGTFISIWHNESLYFRGKWSGWDTVYENMIKYNVQLQNE